VRNPGARLIMSKPVSAISGEKFFLKSRASLGAARRPLRRCVHEIWVET
jgi:hypothetical protein